MPGAPNSLRSRVESLFQRSASPRPDGSIGAELELIPIRDRSHNRVGILAGGDGPGSADIARDVARVRHWSELTDEYGAPNWMMPDGGRLSYEPGGQLEIISPVLASATDLASFLRDTVSALRDAARSAGVQLLAIGVDPYNRVESVALELHAPRYDAMTAYLNSIGPSGARMMRQTASLHLSVELGPNPLDRWALLNSLAPYLVALYANSSVYAGRPTGYASYRSHLWQTLDPTRTGLPYDAVDPIGAYARFANNAGRILDDDRAHLTTLFPEVRPRGYFEIRSMDSMEPERIESALLFISALIRNSDTANAARAIIGAPDAALLARAAEHGRADSMINARLEALEHLAADTSHESSS
jgi:glutamate--cysteine ligase